MLVNLAAIGNGNVGDGWGSGNDNTLTIHDNGKHPKLVNRIKNAFDITNLVDIGNGYSSDGNGNGEGNMVIVDGKVISAAKYLLTATASAAAMILAVSY